MLLVSKKNVLFALALLPVFTSCTEELPNWQEALESIFVEMIFKTDEGDIEIGEIPIPRELYARYLRKLEIIYDEIRRDGSMEFTVRFKNRALEPRDGLIHLEGAFCMSVGWLDRTYKVSFTDIRENEYYELLPGESFLLPMVWDKTFDDGTTIAEIRDSFLPNTEIKFWIEFSFFRYYKNLKSPIHIYKIPFKF